MTDARNYMAQNARFTFAAFSGAYLFGSALDNDAASDIDLLLVYPDSLDLGYVSAEVRDVLDALSGTFQGRNVDLTVLSESELEATKFLEAVRHSEDYR